METEKLKKYAPWIVGGVVGLIVLYKYSGSASSSSTGGTYGTDWASALQAQAQIGAQNQQYQLAQSAQQIAATQAANQLTAQVHVADEQAQTAYVAALGNLAQNFGSSIAGVINAQSQIPAAAINAVAKTNQATLIAAADAAATSFAALPGTLSALANETLAGYSPLSFYGSSLVGLTGTVANAAGNATNGVAVAANGATSATASAATAGANANAQSSAAQSSALGALGVGLMSFGF